MVNVAGRQRWLVCGLLLAATMLSYMDRQALAATAARLRADLHLTPALYGTVEAGFSLAFAAGSVLFGLAADRVSVRALYPLVLLGWSGAGFLTAFAADTTQLLFCRTILGLFEAGHWPCALITVQRLLSAADRPMANGLVQSGSSLGAILTPVLVQLLLTAGYGWRLPFALTGALGLLWAAAWLVALPRGALPAARAQRSANDEPLWRLLVSRRFLSLMLMIALINSSWQLLRAWLPLFLQEGRGYSEAHANYFSSAYYVATDLGTLSAGFVALHLARRGFSPYAARCWTFLGAAALSGLAVVAASLPRGPLLLGTLLLVGFGLLGLFPCYYAFVQDISVRHQGKVTGVLGLGAWVATAAVQRAFGHLVEETGSYDRGLAVAGAAPLVALVVVVACWQKARPAAALREAI